VDVKIYASKTGFQKQDKKFAIQVTVFQNQGSDSQSGVWTFAGR
jgi:hypothetical protein